MVVETIQFVTHNSLQLFLVQAAIYQSLLHGQHERSPGERLRRQIICQGGDPYRISSGVGQHGILHGLRLCSQGLQVQNGF
jgi:hypothetical protein